MGAGFSHVAKPNDICPVLFEDASTEIIELNLPLHLHPGSFEAKIDAAD